jgi:hypothetical protein
MSITLFRRDQFFSLSRNDDIGADEYQDERRCAEQHNPDEMRVAGIFAKLAFVSVSAIVYRMRGTKRGCLDIGGRSYHHPEPSQRRATNGSYFVIWSVPST